MNDTRKNEEQTKEELLKDRELSLEDLDNVSGGIKTDFKWTLSTIDNVVDEDFSFQTGDRPKG